MEALSVSTAFATSGLIVLLGLLVLMLALRAAGQATQITDLKRRIAKLEQPETTTATQVERVFAGVGKAKPIRLAR